MAGPGQTVFEQQTERSDRHDDRRKILNSDGRKAFANDTPRLCQVNDPSCHILGATCPHEAHPSNRIHLSLLYARRKSHSQPWNAHCIFTLMLPPALKNSHLASSSHSKPSSLAICLMRIIGVSPTLSSALSRIFPLVGLPAYVYYVVSQKRSPLIAFDNGHCLNRQGQRG